MKIYNILAVIILLFALAVSSCSKPHGQSVSSTPFPRLPAANSEIIANSGSDDELLCLVNKWNPIAPDYVPVLDYLSDGTAVDIRCVNALRDMLLDCREAGFEPYICSAYRSIDTQTLLFENKVATLLAQGLDETEAREEAAKHVAYPGASEHQLGLAVDIIDSHYTVLDEAQAETDTQLWLMENSWRYGFILRYPEDKRELTGITYEPWHYRYVGKDAAEDIYYSGLCLEEWLYEN